MDDATDERWEAVPGFPNYEGSELGRVRSIPHWDTNKHWHPGQVLNPWMDDKGYLHVTLYRDGRAKKPYVHQVIAWTFLGRCPEGMEVLHGPAGKLENGRLNLSYGTHRQNATTDMDRDGTRRTGDSQPQAKLTVAIVSECRRRNAAHESADVLALEFDVTGATMVAAISGETWKDCPVPPVTGPRCGERHQDAKLTDEIVRECRARRAAGAAYLGLSREFGVSYPAMRAAIIGKTWKHVTL